MKEIPGEENVYTKISLEKGGRKDQSRTVILHHAEEFDSCPQGQQYLIKYEFYLIVGDELYYFSER